MTKKERFDTFVKELEELTKQYDLEIWGCGCCGSPSLFDLKNEKATISEDLAWNDEKQEYEYELVKNAFNQIKDF